MSGTEKGVVSFAQALCGDLDASVKIATQVKAKKTILQAAGGEPSLQLAQLVALEYLLGVALPSRTKEVTVPADRLCFECASCML